MGKCSVPWRHTLFLQYLSPHRSIKHCGKWKIVWDSNVMVEIKLPLMLQFLDSYVQTFVVDKCKNHTIMRAK